IHFRVQVIRGQPRDLRLELVFPGQPIWHELQEQGARRWTRTLRGIEKSFSYRVHGGGTWSPLHQVTLVDRPRIVSLGAQVHYPPYLGITAPLEASRQSIDVTGPEDSQVELRVGVEGQAVEGEIQILESRQESVPVSERGERVWFVDKIPAGAVPEGNWQWERKRWDADESERHTHGEPPAAGVHGHLFHSARIPFEVRPGEHLFAYVYVPADQLPETIMLQWHDGQNWEHRAYWGQDKIGVGQPGTASRQPMGPLPEPGRWVRLEVPAVVGGVTTDLEALEPAGTERVRLLQLGEHAGADVLGQLARQLLVLDDVVPATLPTDVGPFGPLAVDDGLDAGLDRALGLEA
ncbi:MAG: hypothetical protein WD403_07030, partial [Pirellulales bacterium]